MLEQPTLLYPEPQTTQDLFPDQRQQRQVILDEDIISPQAPLLSRGDLIPEPQVAFTSHLIQPASYQYPLDTPSAAMLATRTKQSPPLTLPPQPNKAYDNLKLDEETLKGRYLYTHKYNDVNNDDLRGIRALYNKPKEPNTNNKLAVMSAYIDAYNNQEDGGGGGGDGAAYYSFEDIKSKINRFENDPNSPLEAFEIRFEDRLVFIITTFFIRYAAISIIQRGIDINLVKSFYEGFIYYGAIYIIFFWFIVLFINIDNNYTVEYLDLNGLINYIRAQFYYFYMGTNGVSRLLIHSLMILVIIIIPIILNIKNEKSKDPLNVDADGAAADADADSGADAIERIKPLSLEERTKLSKAISLFTLLIWILTSIIATKF